MEDTLLLCKLVIGRVTLLGYRIDEQYWIVTEGAQAQHTHYIFNYFEDMNLLWQEFKTASESQVLQELQSRREGVQVSKPRRREAPREPFATNDFDEAPAPRPRPLGERPVPPRPRREF